MDELLDSETKCKDYTIVMGDFNAVVGEGKGKVCRTLWIRMPQPKRIGTGGVLQKKRNVCQ